MKIFGFLIVLVIISMMVNPALALSSLDKVVVSESGLVNRSGNPIGTNVNVNQQVLISSKITNAQDVNQDFIYIVQIKNEQGVVIKIGWITGSLTKYQNFVPAVSWVPKTQENFTVEVYVWDGLDQKIHEHEALTSMIKFSVISS